MKAINSATILVLISMLFGSCDPAEIVDVKINKIYTDSTFYNPGSAVKINLTFTNNGNALAHLRIIKVFIRNLDNQQNYRTTVIVPKSKTIGPGEDLIIDQELIWQIPDTVKTAPFGIFMTYKIGEVVHKEEYQTFFHIGEDIERTTYDVSQIDFNGLSVFQLERGLSAEYTVQKAISSLAGGISHSWGNPSLGAGPLPVVSTRDFLDKAVQKTVDLYDQTFDQNKEFETVIISTGIPSGAYLSRAMNAPVLPIHFLVGAHTLKEVETMLDYSADNGTKAYATVGHDYSLSTTQSVAWIKLLSLPEAYRMFLINHKVKNVVFNGALGKGGESGARKLKNGTEHYGTGSVYVMHFAGDNSETYLKQTIRDFDTTRLEPFSYIADWEAGVIEQQVDSIGARAKIGTDVHSITFVTTKDAIHLWNMGSYMMLNLLQKNKLELKGISLNPYLIGHPVFETYQGYMPFLYWQGFDPQFHIDNRLKTVIKEAVEYYYPEKKIKELKYWVNSTNNFGGPDQGLEMSKALKMNNYEQVIDNNYNVDEVWDESDGSNTVCEVRANQLIKSGVQDLQDWNNNLEYLSIADLKKISEKFPEVIIVSK